MDPFQRALLFGAVSARLADVGSGIYRFVTTTNRAVSTAWSARHLYKALAPVPAQPPKSKPPKLSPAQPLARPAKRVKIISVPKNVSRSKRPRMARRSTFAKRKTSRRFRPATTTAVRRFFGGTNARVPLYRGIKSPGFPPRMQMKHKWVLGVGMTGTSGAVDIENVVANGLFLPSPATHQPMYFDNMAAIYNHFAVESSYIQATVMFANATSVPTGVCLFLNDDTTTTPASFTACAEQTGARIKGLLTVPHEPVKLRLGWNCAREFGRKAVMDPTLQGSNAANPTEQSVFTLMIQSLDASSTTQVWVIFEVFFNAVWLERKDLAQQ